MKCVLSDLVRDTVLRPVLGLGCPIPSFAQFCPIAMSRISNADLVDLGSVGRQPWRYHYYIKLVPTIYVNRWGTKTYTNQYSVTDSCLLEILDRLRLQSHKHDGNNPLFCLIPVKRPEVPWARREKCPSEGGWVVWPTWSIPRLRLQSLLDEANWAGQESTAKCAAKPCGSFLLQLSTLPGMMIPMPMVVQWFFNGFSGRWNTLQFLSRPVVACGNMPKTSEKRGETLVLRLHLDLCNSWWCLFSCNPGLGPRAKYQNFRLTALFRCFVELIWHILN